MNKYRHIRFLNLIIFIMLCTSILMLILFGFSNYTKLKNEETLGMDTRFVINYIANQVRMHDDNRITNSIEVSQLNDEPAIYFRSGDTSNRDVLIIYKHKDAVYEVRFTGNEESKSGTRIGSAVVFNTTIDKNCVHIEYQATNTSPIQTENIYLRGGEVYE